MQQPVYYCYKTTIVNEPQRLLPSNLCLVKVKIGSQFIAITPQYLVRDYCSWDFVFRKHDMLNSKKKNRQLKLYGKIASVICIIIGATLFTTYRLSRPYVLAHPNALSFWYDTQNVNHWVLHNVRGKFEQGAKLHESYDLNPESWVDYSPEATYLVIPFDRGYSALRIKDGLFPNVTTEYYDQNDVHWKVTERSYRRIKKYYDHNVVIPPPAL